MSMIWKWTRDDTSKRHSEARGNVTGMCVLLFAGLAACAGPQEVAPQWVSHGKAPGAFPSDRFIIGVGSATDARSAATSARSEIARTFRAHIEQEIADQQRSISRNGQQIYSQDIQARTHVKTNVILRGVRIAETWRDPVDRIHWALATLDLDQERARVEALQAREERKLTSALAAVDQSPAPERKLAALKWALDAARALDAPLHGFIMLSSSRSDEGPAMPSVSSLERRIADLRKQLPIEIAAARIDLESRRLLHAFEPLRVELAQAATELGFPIHESGATSSASWVRVRSHLGTAFVPELSSEFFVYRWEGELELSRSSDSGTEVLAVMSQHGRITHSSDRRARLRAQREAQKALAVQLKGWLADLNIDPE